MSDGTVRQLREIRVYANRFVEIYDDEVGFSSGAEGRFIRITSPMPGRGVVVLAMNEGRIGLVRTFRYPIGEWQWALPRGFSHGVDESHTARQELREELGASAAVLRRIGLITPDSGLQDSVVAIFVAEVSPPFTAPTDTDEVAEVRWVETDVLWSMIASGEIVDGFTLSAMALAQARGELPGAKQP